MINKLVSSGHSGHLIMYRIKPLGFNEATCHATSFLAFFLGTYLSDSNTFSSLLLLFHHTSVRPEQVLMMGEGLRSVLDDWKERKSRKQTWMLKFEMAKGSTWW